MDGAPIAEEQAAALLEEILARVPWALRGGPGGPDDGDGLTFFELTTLVAFLAFARARVDVLVIEVGLGGRLDATNVVEPLAVAITPLGLEHTQYLGPTLARIAAEKAGIIKPSAIAVSAGQPLEAARVLAEAAARCGVPLWRPGRDYRFESRDDRAFCYQGPRDAASAGWTVRLAEPLALPGHHQRQNAALACALLEAAARRGLRIGPDAVARGLSSAVWPGRLERLSIEPLTLLDGAHNPHATRALAHALPGLLGGRPLVLVVGLLADKDAAQTLAPLLPLARALHVCAPDSPRALAPEALAAAARTLAPALPIGVHARAREALAAARLDAGTSGAVVACGSLYLAGELTAAPGPRSAMPSDRL